ncbi:MAG: hypothetical protein QQN63_02585 [Nitrosopumilus sp.]
MKNYRYGSASLTRLHTCHGDLQRIANQALSLGIMDISVICGHRTEKEQDALYPKFTSVKWPDSNHNPLPSLAIDLAPYHSVYGYLSGRREQVEDIARRENRDYLEAYCFIQSEYHRLSGIVLSCARHLKIELRWGGDWDSDSNVLNQTFIDLPHFELVNPS